MSPLFLVFAVCAFASGFALRIIDPLVAPIAHHYGVAPAVAAMLTTAYAIPYAAAQPFLGPIGDRFGKARCIQACVAGLAIALALGPLAPSFALLVASRIVAGVFAGGLIPLVLAGLGDAFDLHERQVAIGRMLFFIITGQMLGSTVAGLVNASVGWRGALAIAAATAAVAALLAWIAIPRLQPQTAAPQASGPGTSRSMRALYGRVFENPKAIWLYGAVVLEGILIFGVFPYVGPLLVARAGSSVEAAAREAGLALGAFGVGGLVYALSVRRILDALGVRRMCIVGAVAAGLSYAALAASTVWWWAAIALGVAGLSYYMLHNSLQTEATEIAPAARGSAVALFAAGLFSGSGLGPLLFGGVAHGLGFPAALLASCVGLLLLGALVVRRIVPPVEAPT
ncbi:MAG TPA: MFS transporter [Caldimonas sp.]|nr:MFS transporter [Caldimonas sp.]